MPAWRTWSRNPRVVAAVAAVVACALLLSLFVVVIRSHAVAKQSAVRPSATAPVHSFTPRPTPPPVNYRFLDPNIYPPSDTPLPSAGHQLQAIWSAYDVALIPGRHVLDAMPTPPQVMNLTHGQVSDATAQAWAWAEYRENAFIGWMERQVQPGLNNHLRDSGIFNGAIGNDVRAGHSVIDPACDLYPQRMALVPVDDAIRQLEGQKGYTVTSDYAFVDLYAGPCSISDEAGVGVFGFTDNGVLIETGAMRHDPVLGDVWYAESGNYCQPQGGPSACNAVH